MLQIFLNIYTIFKIFLLYVNVIFMFYRYLQYKGNKFQYYANVGLLPRLNISVYSVRFKLKKIVKITHKINI